MPVNCESLAERAEAYQLDLEAGWAQAQDAGVRSPESPCASDVPGDTMRFLRVQNPITDVRRKHVLLPLWTLAYRYHGKTYRVLIHGQTGRVYGKAPYSWWKIALVVVAAGAGVLGLLFGLR